MDRTKRETLEAAGFRVGDAEDFLGLTEEERQIVALRVAVARAVRRLRKKMHLSQQELAKRIESSQSRVAKIEAAAEGVSLDLSFRGLFAVGGKLADLAKFAARTAAGSRRQKERGHVHR
jgi:DNA-binding XRE family transcriptional regulator